MFVSAVEHDAVRLQTRGAAVVPVDDDGVVRLDALDEMLSRVERPRVAVMHANNETGVIQPVAEVGALVEARGGTLLVDAVQSAGKLPLPDADYVAVSAHKLGGPPGVGALIVRDAVTPLVRGGGQERGQRAGTENLPGIAGFAAAAAARAADDGWHHRAHDLRDRLEGQLPGAVIHGRGGAAPRHDRLRRPGRRRGDDAADDARPRRLRGERRGGVLVGQGQDQPRSRRDGRRRGRGGAGDPRQLRLDDDGGRDRCLRRGVAGDGGAARTRVAA